MKLTSGRVSLTSPEFDHILDIVDSFHDSSLGCACFDQHGPIAFVDTIWFGVELGYNPTPVVGGIFWFDLNSMRDIPDYDDQYNRAISWLQIDKSDGSIHIQFQDEPFEELSFRFGQHANFQFVASSSLDQTTLKSRRSD